MYGLFAASLPVIAALNQHRHHKDTQLEDIRDVEPTDDHPRHDDQQVDPAEPDPLFLRPLPIGIKYQRKQYIHHRPVSQHRQDAQTDDPQHLTPFGAFPLIPQPQGQQAQKQRIDHAKERQEPNAAGFDDHWQRLVLKQAERHPGNQRKDSQPHGVFFHISGMDIALCYKICHGRSGEAANEMHDLPQYGFHGHKGPGDMVDEHRHDHQIFELVTVETQLFHQKSTSTFPMEQSISMDLPAPLSMDWLISTPVYLCPSMSIFPATQCSS